MHKALAEFIGTFTLVLLGCGAAVIAGPQIGVLGIAFAFGLALIGMAYGIGPVSGCHINPAVSLGVLIAGRMSSSDFIQYVVDWPAGQLLVRRPPTELFDEGSPVTVSFAPEHCVLL